MLGSVPEHAQWASLQPGMHVPVPEHSLINEVLCGLDGATQRSSDEFKTREDDSAGFPFFRQSSAISV